MIKHSPNDHDPILSTRVPPEQLAALETIWRRDGISKSEQVRRALAGWIEQREELHRRIQHVERKGAR